MGASPAVSESTVSEDATSGLAIVDAPLVKYIQNKSAGGQRFYDKAGIQKFYVEREYAPVWLRGKSFNKKAKQVLNVFGESWKHGLNPENYAYTNLVKASKTDLGDDALLFEAMMSASVVRYGRDMTSMRIPPSEIKQKAKFWQKPLESYSILMFVASDRNTKKAMKALAPQSNIYVRLQKELLSVTKAIEKGDLTESVLPLSVRGSLRLGDTSAIVEDIRYRLDAPSVKHGEDPAVYGDRLSQSVMAFQTIHGLKADGIIGRKTVNAMNRTLKDKRDQIIVNLERIRWLESDMPSKYLVVNIPAQTLWAIDDDKVEIEMPVIIGRYKRQTNSFVSRVTGVRLNPTWTVPETIKFEDYLPKLSEDPNYLNDKGVEFMWGSGAEALSLPPESIQWEYLSKSDIKSIRMVQGPGANNPLGRIRLHMPNQFNIYLHDTNNRAKFLREDRALSSGCVRMYEPEKIAKFVLSENKNWSDKKMQEILEKGEMVDIGAQLKIPVYILYQTIWAGKDGKLIYGGDIYDRDKSLLRVLKKYNAVFEESDGV